MPKEKDIHMIKEIFKKYYNKECFLMFEEAISFNKIFLKNNPMYKSNKYKFSLSFYKHKHK